jgi:carbon monoxide dehydrogenase subunit G
MRFENRFSVDAPIDEVWGTLLDLEKVAPAMPGAQVTDKVDDRTYKVAIKVKLGPMTMNYRGDVEIRDRDDAAHRATMHVKAREARGQGTATADVKMSLDEEAGKTDATIEAEVQLAGRAAAMGRGLIEDVSAKLVDQFADNLSSMLSGGGGDDGNGGAEPAAAEEPAPASGAARPAAASGAQQPAGGGDDSLDALGLASGIARDKLREPRTLAMVVGGALLVGWLLRRLAGH